MIMWEYLEHYVHFRHLDCRHHRLLLTVTLKRHLAKRQNTLCSSKYGMFLHSNISVCFNYTKKAASAIYPITSHIKTAKM